jgi:RNA polymerase sigma factor (sigma-70 family)
MKPHSEDDPPDSTDLDGWRQAVGDGRYRSFRGEAVVAAIQDLGANADPRVITPLVEYVSKRIVGILRKRIGTNYPNRGEDMIDDVHGQLVMAILTPDSADGQGLRKAFVPRIGFRAGDALRAAKKRQERECSVENIDELCDARYGGNGGTQQEIEEKEHVEKVLSCITNERKRLAFRLYMEGLPLNSKKTDSIAKALGVSAKTVGQWIEEVKAQLKPIVGELS